MEPAGLFLASTGVVWIADSGAGRICMLNLHSGAVVFALPGFLVICSALLAALSHVCTSLLDSIFNACVLTKVLVVFILLAILR